MFAIAGAPKLARLFSFCWWPCAAQPGLLIFSLVSLDAS
jgi:hypothetical protein